MQLRRREKDGDPDMEKKGQQTTVPLRVLVLVLVAVASGAAVVYEWRACGQTESSSYAAAFAASAPSEIRSRRQFKSYDEYVALQLKKTLNPRLRRLWRGRDWERKVERFAELFLQLKSEGLLPPRADARALCVGARMGQEVEALRRVGVLHSVGIDLVPSEDEEGLVVRGDMHRHPFNDSAFDLEFSNAFDHALYPQRFAAEMERTLRPGGVAVLHVALHTRSDRFSANDIVGGRVDAVVALFRRCTLVHVRPVDAFGLDTEVVLRRKADQNDHD